MDAGTAAIIAASIAAVVLLANSALVQWLQYRRDRTQHDEQVARDTQEYERRREEAQEVQRQTLERENAEHRHARQVARLERLRACYVSVLVAANAYMRIARSLNTDLLPGVTIEKRNEVLTQELVDGERNMSLALAELQVEGASKEVLDLFQQVSDATTGAIAAYNLKQSRARNRQPDLDATPYLDKLTDALDRLVDTMRKEIAELDRAS